MKKFLEIFKKTLFAAVQVTWGLPQTFCGLIVFLLSKGTVSSYRCAVHRKWEKEEGLSLGLFIFTPPDAEKRIKDHEYGHSLQSLILGPLYLPVIGLPSLIWCRSGKLAEYRKKNHRDYFSFYPEKLADTLGKAKSNEVEEVHHTYNS